jgi:hypothetical protein
MKTAALLLVMALAASATPIPWELTTSVLMGKKAFVTLQDGTRLEGNWLGVTPDSFHFEVQKARGPNRPSRGIHTFERGSLKELRLQERRVRGRVWGLVFGYFGGALPALHLSSSGAASFVVLLCTTTGFLAGHAADKATREVRIEVQP